MKSVDFILSCSSEKAFGVYSPFMFTAPKSLRDALPLSTSREEPEFFLDVQTPISNIIINFSIFVHEDKMLLKKV